MLRVLVYYAHPGHTHSHANRELAQAASKLPGISFVDLYALYPRFDIDIDLEQQRLREHDVVVFQFPLFWYSCPALIKEWLDLVLEQGFAYGPEGDALHRKTMQLALTAAGSTEAYTAEGYQHFPLREFLTPFEQTARLCGMQFAAPYVLFDALHAHEDERLGAHVAGYVALLQRWQQGTHQAAAAEHRLITAETLGLEAAEHG